MIGMKMKVPQSAQPAAVAAGSSRWAKSKGESARESEAIRHSLGIGRRIVSRIQVLY